MAKKKEAVLTPEERLRAVLVPDWEQPYKIPENWCWIKLIGVLRHQSGNSKLIKGKLSAKKRDGFYDAYSASGQDVYMDSYEHEGTAIIVSAVGARCGKAFLATGKWSAVANTHIIYSNNAVIDIHYLYYILNDESWWVKSGSAQPFVAINESLSRPFALPPVLEQRRIVDRIENLFSKLDEAKKTVQGVLDSFESRTAAILHKAFTGELTTQWREEHGVGMESWKKSRFDEVAAIKSNLVNPADFPDFPHIAPDNIEKKTGVLLNYHTVSEDGVVSGKHRFYPGQILYSKIRPYLSKVIVVDFDGLCSADMYPVEAKKNVKCLWYYMLSEEFLEQASSAGSRSVLPKINQKELSALTVFLPTSEDEQAEIVCILDKLLAKEQQAKEAAGAVLEQIDLIKKSILVRAFRGELGTNDPSEENSIELLKRSFGGKIEIEKDKSKRIAKQNAEVTFVPKTIMEALSKDVRLTPENLKSETGLPIDDFYAQLKELIDNGSVTERRENGESYLEAADENRQTEN